MDVHSSIIYNRQKVETTQMSSRGEWMNEMWSIHTTEYYSAIKRHEVLTHATTGMNLGNTWSVKEARSKATYCMIPLVGNAQKRRIRIHRWKAGAGQGEMGKDLTGWVSCRGGNALELDHGDGRTTW